jgi:hypothetical protein
VQPRPHPLYASDASAVHQQASLETLVSFCHCVYLRFFSVFSNFFPMF